MGRAARPDELRELMATDQVWQWGDYTPSAPVERDNRPSNETGERTSGVTQIALVLTYAASAATAWNGLKEGGFRIGDMLIGLTVLIFFFSDLGRKIPKLPGWVWQFGGIIVLITAAHAIVPTDAHYLHERLVFDGSAAIPGGLELETNSQVGIKFLVPVIFMPLMFGYAYSHDKRAILRSAYGFAAGASISALVGTSDLLLHTHFSLKLTHLPAINGRAPGLTLHPNFLAMTCVIALPIMLWQLFSPSKRVRVIAGAFIVVLLLGLYVSGSRAGAAVGPGIMLFSVIIMPRYRRFLPSIAVAVGGIVVAIFVLKPSLGHQLLQAVRLSGNTGSADGSDQARAIIFKQGVADFQHSPIDGVGMQVAEEAHNVYLQALAAGGVILLAGYLIFVFSGLFKAIQQMKYDPLAYALFAGALGGAIFVIVQAALTDRIAYMMLALIATLPKGEAADPELAEVMSTTAPAVEAPRRPITDW